MKLFDSVGAPTSVDWLAISKSALTNYDVCMAEDPEISEYKADAVSFLLEQLHLLTAAPTRRRYKTSTVRQAYTLMSISATAYDTLRDMGILTLPHRTTLNRITAGNNDGDLSTVNTVNEYTAYINSRDPVRADRADAAAIVWTCAALVRAELDLRPCRLCSSLLTVAKNATLILPHIDPHWNVFESIDAANRGGLLKPSRAAYDVCEKAWEVFVQMRTSIELIVKFSKTDERRCFSLIVQKVSERDFNLDNLGATMPCEAGHDWAQKLTGRYFNTLMNMYVHQLTTDVAEKNRIDALARKRKKQENAAAKSEPKQKNSRKQAKLQSSTTAC